MLFDAMQPLILTSSLCVLAASVLLTGSFGQKPEDPKPTPTRGQEKEMDRIQRDLQGLWKLTAMDWPMLRDVATEQTAYCLVSGNVLSMEFHIIVKGPGQRTEQTIFDSGIWRFEIAEANRLMLTSIIGSYLRPEDPNVLVSPFIGKANRLEFRVPGSTHRYDVQLLGDKLIMTHATGQKLTFQRTPIGANERRDAYGRVIPEKEVSTPKDK
jgi:hypothetical protein